MDRPIYVIDCGSGSSRLSKYSYHDDGYVHEDLYIPSGIIPTLATSISKQKQHNFVHKLRAALQDLDPGASLSGIKLIVGATGGLRKALDEGTVTAKQVEYFRKCLHEAFPKSEFLQYTGQEEAQLELAAVRYIARHALPGAIPVFTGGRASSGAIGTVSCGGSSSQIAYFDPETQEDVFLSFRTDLISTMKQLREVGDGDEFKYLKLESKLWNLIKTQAPPRKLTGTFVVIELAGSIGKEAGLADRLVPKREAVQLITQHFQTLSLVSSKDNRINLKGGKTGRTDSSLSFFAEARRPLTIIVEAMLNMFSSACTFFFATSFDIGGHDNILRAQWPLGVALGKLQPPILNTPVETGTPISRNISKL